MDGKEGTAPAAKLVQVRRATEPCLNYLENDEWCAKQGDDLNTAQHPCFWCGWSRYTHWVAMEVHKRGGAYNSDKQRVRERKEAVAGEELAENMAREDRLVKLKTLFPEGEDDEAASSSD